MLWWSMKHSCLLFSVVFICSSINVKRSSTRDWFLLFPTDDDVPEQGQVTEECYLGNGVTYRGTASFTLSGKRCQAWSSMSPHRHNKTARNFPNAYVHFLFPGCIHEQWMTMVIHELVLICNCTMIIKLGRECTR